VKRWKKWVGRVWMRKWREGMREVKLGCRLGEMGGSNWEMKSSR
jgi:hypothetical protein